jgi:hypothetical protein
MSFILHKMLEVVGFFPIDSSLPLRLMFLQDQNLSYIAPPSVVPTIENAAQIAP